MIYNHKISQIVCILLLVIIMNGCSKSTHNANAQLVTASCEPVNGMQQYCGFTNPEDMVSFADASKLLVSEMGVFMQDTPGSLSVLDISSKQKQSIDIQWSNDGELWGDKNCSLPQVDLFSPHGIDLMTRIDNHQQLLVVNHGGRESVEFFELLQSGKKWQLHWKGCALPPNDPFLNDVAGLQNGGFVVTHMWNKNQAYPMIMIKYVLGINTGWVWEWHPQSGFKKLDGSGGLAPNGIVVNADNSQVYLNLYGDNKTVKINRLTGRIENELEVQQPDNVSIDEQGNLWIASHKHSAITQNCDNIGSGPCMLPFEIIKTEPNDMRKQVVLSHEGPPMGYATVALNVNNTIYIGSAYGDRIVSVELE